MKKRKITKRTLRLGRSGAKGSEGREGYQKHQNGTNPFSPEGYTRGDLSRLLALYTCDVIKCIDCVGSGKRNRATPFLKLVFACRPHPRIVLGGLTVLWSARRSGVETATRFIKTLCYGVKTSERSYESYRERCEDTELDRGAVYR